MSESDDDSGSEISEEEHQMVYFDMLIAEERRGPDSGMRQSIRRSTAIDKVIERKCFLCNSLQPPYVYHCD